jgi:colanic acid/amylovoran biosynthesis protein
MAKIALLGNGPITNRGCEAIVLGTRAIVERTCGPSEFLLASFADDAADALPEDVHPLHLPLYPPRWSAEWVTQRARHYLGLPQNKSGFLKHINGQLAANDAVLSIGGDGYAIDYGTDIVDRLILMNDHAHRKGLPVAIWGASIGPFDRDPAYERMIMEHFKALELIVVREPRSLAYLEGLGVMENVMLAPDPAFVVKPNQSSLPAEVSDMLTGGCVGVNLSPLMAKYVTDGDIETWQTQAAGLVEQVIEATGMPVLLIYHVTAPDHPFREKIDDHLFLEGVLSGIDAAHRERVTLLPNGLGCAELKWVISRTQLFIGARTHSTIAAISTQVPCISLAYSRKAWGLNEQIFGHHDWVVPPTELDSGRLAQTVARALEADSETRRHYAQAIPAARAAAYQAGERLQQLIG